MEDVEIEMLPHLLTCHTEGCDNADIPILVDMPVGGGAACGPCGQVITDISGPLA